MNDGAMSGLASKLKNAGEQGVVLSAQEAGALAERLDVLEKMLKAIVSDATAMGASARKKRGARKTPAAGSAGSERGH